MTLLVTITKDLATNKAGVKMNSLSKKVLLVLGFAIVNYLGIVAAFMLIVFIFNNEFMLDPAGSIGYALVPSLILYGVFKANKFLLSKWKVEFKQKKG